MEWRTGDSIIRLFTTARCRYCCCCRWCRRCCWCRRWCWWCRWCLRNLKDEGLNLGK